MTFVAKNYLVVILGILIASSLSLAAWLWERRASRKSRRPRWAVATVEQHEDGAVVVLPPQPGVRVTALMWTLLPTLLVVYVCLIIDASAAGWALFVGAAFLMAAVPAYFHRELLTMYYFVDAEQRVRIARGRRSWRRASEPLSPPKMRGRVSIGRDNHGAYYFHHNGREEDGVWGRLSYEAAQKLRALGVPDDRDSPTKLSPWTLSSWLYTLAGFALLASMLYPMFSPLAKVDALQRLSLSGGFRADHSVLGHWESIPQRCLSGRERGFEGVMFTFPSGAVRELRVDMERPGNATLEFRFFDPDKQPLRIASGECERLDATVEATVMVVNGRDMDLLEGQLSIACARYGLRGEASFRGCLP